LKVALCKMLMKYDFIENDADPKTAPPAVLDDLRPGDSGVIAEIRLPPERQLYLLEVGFLPGEEVRFIRRSPWGDPLEVEVLGVRLAIRREDAQAIFVNRSAGAS